MRAKEVYSNALIVVFAIWLQGAALLFNAEPTPFVVRVIFTILGDACLMIVAASLTADFLVRKMRNVKF